MGPTYHLRRLALRSTDWLMGERCSTAPREALAWTFVALLACLITGSGLLGLAASLIRWIAPQVAALLLGVGLEAGLLVGLVALLRAGLRRWTYVWEVPVASAALVVPEVASVDQPPAAKSGEGDVVANGAATEPPPSVAVVAALPVERGGNRAETGPRRRSQRWPIPSDEEEPAPRPGRSRHEIRNERRARARAERADDAEDRHEEELLGALDASVHGSDPFAGRVVPLPA